MPEFLPARDIVSARECFRLQGAWGECDILCPVCWSVLHTFDDGEGAFAFCTHTIALLCDGEGPSLWRGASNSADLYGNSDSLHQDYGFGEEDGHFTAAPLVDDLWMRVEIHYQGDPNNWSWKLHVAWPVDRLRSGDPRSVIRASLAELADHLEARFGAGL